MPTTVISVENLSKSYQLGAIGTGTFKGDVQRWWTKLRGLPDPHFKIGEKDHGNRDGETIWALKDINFQVRQGEAIGIIGRNGAGKSTLLKILSCVTAPTSGEIKIKGKIASLLEVGTGFHPELTGRENIFMNGAIMGMDRREIQRKFDQIVDFSGVEKYIDTPVKRYSSGMYVRLAFAVAAHLEPEILVVDEVLAVGDAEFQKKCLGKMGDVTKEGRTVLFVSHNMNAVNELCERGLLLVGGEKTMDAAVQDVVGTYLSASGNAQSVVDLDALHHVGHQNFAKLTRLTLMDANLVPTTGFRMNEPFIARVELEVSNLMKNAEVGVKISSRYGTAIHYLTSTWEGIRGDLEPGKHIFEVRVPKLFLYPGKYQIGLWVLREGEWSDDNIQEVTYFEVIKGDVTGFPTTIDKYAYSGCEVYAPCTWREIYDWESD